MGGNGRVIAHRDRAAVASRGFLEAQFHVVELARVQCQIAAAIEVRIALQVAGHLNQNAGAGGNDRAPNPWTSWRKRKRERSAMVRGH